MVAVLHKAKIVKARLESLDKSNVSNRKISVEYREGSTVDRTRVSITHGLRFRLRDIMNDFRSLREKIGEAPSDEFIEKMAFGRVEMFKGIKDQKDIEVNLENKERHEAVMDIQRSLDKLHKVFLDMAILVETQGEEINDIEQNMANAKKFMSGGTNSLVYAKQMKKKGNRWVYWVWTVGFIILLVCFVTMLSS
ncbi:hypothetical protein LguiA_014059 [Lonicera macranthoides]